MRVVLTYSDSSGTAYKTEDSISVEKLESLTFSEKIQLYIQAIIDFFKLIFS